MNRRIQATGVAPTDDGFTIIGPGVEDIDKNGPALVGDPDLGFSGLQTFGSVLVNHTQLKIRKSLAIKDFMIVDTPGMIDSPIQHHHLHQTPSKSENMDRGYNFEGVIRWYAERADVILLFFDPDKPGTTGETLSILTNSLVGLDHKLFIILNKADQFHRIHDFARAYGSLCWNLSKVIPRKDLPRIHTMCLPSAALDMGNEGVDGSTHESAATAATTSDVSDFTIEGGVPLLKQSFKNNHAAQLQQQHYNPVTNYSSFYDQGHFDLDEAREEVIKEVYNAPRRRIDNEISRLTDSVAALLMHCRIVEALKTSYKSKVWRGRLWVGATAAISVGITVAAGYIFDWSRAAKTTLHESITGGAKELTSAVQEIASSTISGQSSSSSGREGTLAVVSSGSKNFLSELIAARPKAALLTLSTACGALATLVVRTVNKYFLGKTLAKLTTPQSYQETFKSLYLKEVSQHDLYTIALGEIVVDHLTNNFTAQSLVSVPLVRKEDRQSLERILNGDIANLRRTAAPDFQCLSPVRTPLNSQVNLNIWSSEVGYKLTTVRSVHQRGSSSDLLHTKGGGGGGSGKGTPLPHLFTTPLEAVGDGPLSNSRTSSTGSNSNGIGFNLFGELMDDGVEQQDEEVDDVSASAGALPALLSPPKDTPGINRPSLNESTASEEYASPKELPAGSDEV